MPPTTAELRSRLPELMLRDQHRLRRRIERVAVLRGNGQREQELAKIAADLDAAAERPQARRRSVPAIRYPAELPVSQRKDDIAAAIRDNQVVIIAGETGSGKTTQIPKICLELGRGVTGQIGHTQPRRLAARTVAERIADELGVELGSAIGYKVRFTDTSSDNTLVKLMTDGILLTELQHDRRLLRYDTLIIDEAHERSLNIDFILGYVRRLLPSRPDLKVIITSATIDPERFSEHFAVGESGKQSAGGESGKQSAGGESGKQSAGGESGKQSAGGESGKQSHYAPIIEVSGRTYPVEVRYRPLVPDADDANGDELVNGRRAQRAEPRALRAEPRALRAEPRALRAEPRDQVQAIMDAIDELRAEGPGDILVFLSGEREIRDTADALTGGDHADLEVLPLYARLSVAEQHKVFAGGERSKQGQPHRSRRVVLATNVAETSLTVPGIKYVIDPGTARISRYSNRTKVQRLPIEPISQASANQRKGRCGRTSDGICIRLYSEADFAGRPEFTDPEILRTNLASVILQMAALDLGEVAGFPFIDPPDTRQVTDGVRLLAELGAVRPEGKGAKSLTGIGRKLARLPVDPRLGRMIIEAGGNDCAREVLIIAAALSIQDPRERPADFREAADAQHARFAEPGSDFLSLLNLWDYLRDQQRELSGSAFRRMCRREYLHYLRVREWQDVYGQLRQASRELGITVGPDRTPAVAAAPAAETEPAHGGPTAHVAQLAAKPGSEVSGRIPDDLAERVHRSLLAGLLSHIGMRDVASGERRRGPAEFLGARSARFAIFSDSVLARKPPQWVVAAELVETSRLWARVTARIEPEWAEPLAAHLIKREYSEPHWDGRRGAAMAYERVSLYGLPLAARRRVTLSSIDPVLARELFISHGLVEGDWQTHHRFFYRNRQLLAEAEELELRARRRGIVADDAALFAFYDRRIPAEVTSARHFDSWWKRARQAEPDLLTLTEADLAGPAADEVLAENYPSTWGGLELSYEFAPGETDDGVTADVPLAALNQVSADEFSWNVPGLRLELVTELIRTLPKQLRTRFVPAPDVARDVLTRLDPGRGALIDQLSAELGRAGGVSVPADAFDLAKLRPHLRLTFRVTDDGQVLATGKDLMQLRGELRPRLQERLAASAGELTRTGITSWDFGELPRVFSHGQVRAYPALRDAGNSVEIALFETPEHAAEAMVAGNRRLLLLQVPSGARAVASRLPTSAKLAMARHPYGNAGEMVDDCAAAAADEIVMAAGGPAWDAETFAQLLDAARSSLAAKAADVVSVVARVLGEAHRVEAGLDGAKGAPMSGAVADMRHQFAGLIHRGFIADAGARRLTDLARYLRAMTHRLEKAPADVRRDASRMEVVLRVTDDYHDALAKLGPDAQYGQDVRAIRWMIEELRVSLFAPSIGAAGRVSEQRILAALDRL